MSVIIGVLAVPMHFLMPLNKKLYSASFTLTVIGVSGVMLTIFYAFTDILPARHSGARRVVEAVTAPLKWLGLNPLAVFVGMDVLAILMGIYIKINDRSVWSLFYSHVFSSWISHKEIASTVFACFFLVLWTLVAGLMHRCKLYLRL